MPECGQCGAAVAATAKFCTKCGAKTVSPPAYDTTPVQQPSATKRCPQCGAENLGTAKFCRVDGVQFESIHPPPALAQASLDEGVPCPVCAFRNRPEARFCKMDGTPLGVGENGVAAALSDHVSPGAITDRDAFVSSTASGQACPKCGMTNVAEALFCKTCGTELSDTAATVRSGVVGASANRSKNGSGDLGMGRDAVHSPQPYASRETGPQLQSAMASRPSNLQTMVMSGAAVAVVLAGAMVAYLFWPGRIGTPKTVEISPRAARASANEILPAPLENAGGTTPSAALMANARTSAGETTGSPTTQTAPVPDVNVGSMSRSGTAAPMTPDTSNSAAAVRGVPPPTLLNTGALPATVTGQQALREPQNRDSGVQTAASISPAPTANPPTSGTALARADPRAAKAPVSTVPPSSAIAPSSGPDPAKLEGEINRALRDAGLGSVTVQVADDLTLVLKGTARGEADKNRAFQIARGFRDVKSAKDQVFIVE